MSKSIWFFGGIVLLIGGVIIYNKVLHPPEKAGRGPAGGPPNSMSVEGFIVQPKTLENKIIASGTLLANEDVELHAEVSGKITQLNLNEGAPVTKGALLVKLFDADLQAQLRKLEAQKETAEKTEQRLKQLLAINGIGQQDYDNALTALKGISADIDYVQAQITKTEIKAPFNGIMGLRNVSIGAFVSPSVSIASLQQIDPLKVDFSVPEKYQSSMRKGDLIKFTVDGFSESFSGKIFAIEPHVDETTRTIKARALVGNAKATLLPGAFAKIDLGLKAIDNAMMIPTQSIIPEARTKKVIVLKDGKADFRIVETGIRTESYIQVTDGIMPGDTVVTTAIMYVKPGMDLKLKKLTE
ncbi:MAG: efflux RND transporter periplasmic adaptor subunit [Bacteroidetes bacterium]|nr:efflux RND transporter periplasmic adaptor subunit [Bacteroidota bacterium]